MKKTVFAFCLLTISLVSCKKEPQPAPELQSNPELRFSRAINYSATSETAGVNYSPSDIQSSIFQSTADHRLSISFEVPYPVGNDFAAFTVAGAKVKPGYVGDYSIVAGNDGNAGDVKAQYNYELTSTSANLHLPGMAEGSLKITAYNEKFKMLSGEYSFQILSNQDPRAGIPVVWRDNKITVTGTFKNIVIKPN